MVSQVRSRRILLKLLTRQNALLNKPSPEANFFLLRIDSLPRCGIQERFRPQVRLNHTTPEHGGFFAILLLGLPPVLERPAKGFPGGVWLQQLG